MLNKLCTSVPQIACLLFFILVLASSTSANAIYKSDGSLPVSKKVVDFNVHISESGEEYNETIEVDTEKQTELFQVPAHPGVDRSDVLNDFKQKLTMIRIPDKKICYLLPLAKEQSTPEKLIRDLEKVEKEVITKVRRIDNTWILESELTERSFLSGELQQFCTDYPIYLVKKTQDSLAVTAIKTDAEIKRRKRRQSMPYGRPLCQGGMTYDEALSVYPSPCNYKPVLRCKVESRTCYKWVDCSVGGNGEPLPPSLRRMDITYKKLSNGCWQFHEWSNVVCCHYVC